MRLSLIFSIQSNLGIFWHEGSFVGTLRYPFNPMDVEKPTASTSEQPVPKRPGNRRIILLLLLLGVILAFRGKVMFEIDLSRNVRADELTEDFVDGVMALPEGRFRRVVRELWASGKFVHRQEALTFVGYQLNNLRATELGEWEPYVSEALSDPDSGLREMAMNLLVKTTGASAVPDLLAELGDPDHELRVSAMRHLRNLGATNTLPAVATQLAEENPRLVCETVNWLRRVTGVDHGMRSKWISRRALIGPGEASLNHSNYLRAKDAAVSWWRANGTNWPSVTIPPLPRNHPSKAISLADDGLWNADLKPFDPKTLGGGPLLIYFFTTWKSAAAKEAMDVRKFHEEMAGRASVLGVSLDAVPDEHNENQLSIMFEKDDHGHGHHHHHDHGGEYEMAYQTGEIIQETERKISNLGFKFPVVYDLSGRFMNRLNGSEVPTLVMLDAERRVFRRMSGPRRVGCLVAVAQAAGSK